jgi:hypothetical protein
MIVRVHALGVALAGVLAFAPACLAAPPAYEPGKGGIGVQIGLSTFRFDRNLFGSDWFGDYSLGAKSRPRFAFAAQFRYVARPWLRLQLGPEFTWASYLGDQPIPFPDVRFPDDQTKGQFLTNFVAIPLEAHYVMRRGSWLYYGGGGPGIYRVWVENNREVLKDPATFKLHRGLYAGVSAHLGAEKFFGELNSTSVEFAFGGNLAFTERDDQFKSGYNSNVGNLGIRIGGNYYFHTAGEKQKPAEAASPTTK